MILRTSVPPHVWVLLDRVWSTYKRYETMYSQIFDKRYEKYPKHSGQDDTTSRCCGFSMKKSSNNTKAPPGMWRDLLFIWDEYLSEYDIKGRVPDMKRLYDPIAENVEARRYTWPPCKLPKNFWVLVGTAVGKWREVSVWNRQDREVLIQHCHNSAVHIHE